MKRKSFIVSICILIVCLIMTGCATQGKSAYEVALDNGFVGTQAQWLEFLHGKDGVNGQDGQDLDIQAIYDVAKQNGYNGSILDFMKEYFSSCDIDLVNSNVLSVNRAMMSGVIIFKEIPKYYNGQLLGYGYKAGAGVIIKDDKSKGNATIITNHHVLLSQQPGVLNTTMRIGIYGMTVLRDEHNVENFYNSTIEAHVIGSSPQNDIGVLEIRNSDKYAKSGCLPVKVADSDDIVLGETAFAIGNPELQGFSVTSGVVSVLNEYINIAYPNAEKPVTIRAVRVDTAINGGNSGGGLFNDKGELIGITNAKDGRADVENISYAIPSNVAVSACFNILRNNGTYNKCLIGITTQENNVRTALNSMGIIEKKADVTVVHVEKGYIADGKIKQGDIIRRLTLVDASSNDIILDKDIVENFQIGDIMINAKVGDKLSVSLERQNQPLSVDLIVK